MQALRLTIGAAACLLSSSCNGPANVGATGNGVANQVEARSSGAGAEANVEATAERNQALGAAEREAGMTKQRPAPRASPKPPAAPRSPAPDVKPSPVQPPAEVDPPHEHPGDDVPR